MVYIHTLPRLYITDTLSLHHATSLNEAQIHYLFHVMRKTASDQIRIFNGKDGEFLAEIETISKKNCVVKCIKQLKMQSTSDLETHLIFTPIKKTRLDFLIEKSVELGVTHLHPVITSHTSTNKINTDRIESKLTEAAEQCERLDIPQLNTVKSLEYLLHEWDKYIQIYACIERIDQHKAASTLPEKCAFLIGPEGGISNEEKAILQKLPYVTPISLGNRILRSETACLAALSLRILENPC